MNIFSISKQSRPALLAAVASLSVALSAGAAQAIGECAKFGKPAYVADRTTYVGGETVRARVYVMGDSEREEISRGDRTEIIIVTPREFMSFDPVAKIGFRRSMGGKAPPPGPGSAIRVREEPGSGSSRLILEGQDPDGSWRTLNEVVCRSDGAILSKKSSGMVNGQPVSTTMTQSIVSSGGVSSAMFSAPAGIKFGR